MPSLVRTSGQQSASSSRRPVDSEEALDEQEGCMSRMRMFAVVSAVALLSGCSKSKPPADASVKDGTVPTPTATVPTRPDPTETPTPQQTTFKMGDVVRTKLGNKVVVYDWNTNVNWPINANGGDVYSQIEVKYCQEVDQSGKPQTASEIVPNFFLEMPGS